MAKAGQDEEAQPSQPEEVALLASPSALQRRRLSKTSAAIILGVASLVFAGVVLLDSSIVPNALTKTRTVDAAAGAADVRPLQFVNNTKRIIQRNDMSFLVNYNHVIVDARPFLLAVCHSYQPNTAIETPPGKQIVTYTDRGNTLGYDDAQDAVAMILTDFMLPNTVGPFPVKSIVGESVSEYPCKGDDKLLTAIYKLDPSIGSMQTLVHLKSSDCLEMSDLLKLMQKHSIDLLVMLACKSYDTATQAGIGQLVHLAGKCTQKTSPPVQIAQSPAEGRGKETLLNHLKLDHFGVLGVQEGGNDPRDVIIVPDTSMAILDPTDLNVIRSGIPQRAGGASRAIYKWLSLDNFPSELHVLQSPGDAVLVSYPGKTSVIHTLSVDFRFVTKTQDEAVRDLATAYRNVFSEFIKTDLTVLRILPLVGGTFAGSFKGNIADMTFAAMQQAFEQLQPSEQPRLLQRNVEFCVYSLGEFAQYQKAYWDKKKSLAAAA
mmetsp:Transcript_168184/g.540300  ORF Transcript_168184/g.540300 Transcript_168184/m.540300 type:complete len:489 (+) Transcript_168184:61-1527(+)